MANYTRNQLRGVFKKQSKPSKSAAIRTHNYDRVARAAGEFADTGQGSARVMQSRGFWLRSTCRNCCNVDGGISHRRKEVS